MKQKCYFCKKIYVGGTFRENNIQKMRNKEGTIIMIQEFVETFCDTAKKHIDYKEWVCSECAEIIGNIVEDRIRCLIENGSLHDMVVLFINQQVEDMEEDEEEYEIPPSFGRPRSSKIDKDNYMYG